MERKLPSLRFIIEEGQFNLGNFNRALQFIEIAALTGADSLEFQLRMQKTSIESHQGFSNIRHVSSMMTNLSSQ